MSDITHKKWLFEEILLRKMELILLSATNQLMKDFKERFYPFNISKSTVGNSLRMSLNSLVEDGFLTRTDNMRVGSTTVACYHVNHSHPDIKKSVSLSLQQCKVSNEIHHSGTNTIRRTPMDTTTIGRRFREDAPSGCKEGNPFPKL